MKIKIKTLKRDLFEVEVSEDQATVADVKAAIAAQKADMPAEQLKLIHSGSIWKDETKISETGYKDADFVVAMLARKAPAPAAAEETSAATPAPAATPQPAAVAPNPSPQPASNTTVGGGADATAAANAQVVNGAGAEATIAQLCDMGFARTEVEHCLRAAFGNPDRAVEYLMTGIPEGLDQGGEGGAEPAQQGGQPDGANPLTNMIASGGGGIHPDVANAVIPPELEQLRSNPQLAQLASVILQNPEAAQSLLPALAMSHPELANAVQAHPAAFARLLMEASGQGAGAPGAGGDDPAAPPGTVTVRLSQDDRAAVERLSAMGFERNLAVQAYLACEKNEELAVNFLLENAAAD